MSGEPAEAGVERLPCEDAVVVGTGCEHLHDVLHVACPERCHAADLIQVVPHRQRRRPQHLLLQHAAALFRAGMPRLELLQRQHAVLVGVRLCEALTRGGFGKGLRADAHALRDARVGFVQHLEDGREVGHHLREGDGAVAVQVEDLERGGDFALLRVASEDGQAGHELAVVHLAIAVRVKHVEQARQDGARRRATGGVAGIRQLAQRRVERGVGQRVARRVGMGAEHLQDGHGWQRAEPRHPLHLLHAHFKRHVGQRHQVGGQFAAEVLAVGSRGRGVPRLELLRAQLAVVVRVSMLEALTCGGQGKLLGADLQPLALRRV